MKKKHSVFCVLLSALMCIALLPAEFVGAVTVNTLSSGQISKNGEQIKGTEDGYSYELWNQNDDGTATMTLGSGGAYSCEWKDIENVLFRRGVDFDCTKTYKELGNIEVEYEAEYNNPNQNTYLCVYGWTRNPLIEYYIVDSWGSWRPPGADSKGTITVDGGVYDVYVTDRINQSSIDGNTTFKQYWSVRQQKRTSGTISVSQHFAEWEKMGMETGKLYEAALNVEGYRSSGKANITKNVVSVGGEIKEPEPIKPVEPDENGYYFHSTFESGTDNWDSRGSSNISTVSTSAFEGSKCLSVTERTDSWNGTGYVLDTNTFVPGESYSFSVMAMQNAVDSEDFKLTLQYELEGKANYSEVASAKGAKDKWVQLANTSFTIPSGASSLLLYVETDESMTDFFIDEAVGAVKDTVISGGSQEKLPLLGDVNADSVVNIDDVKDLQKYLINEITVLEGAESADISGDGLINIFDLVLLKRMILAKSASPDTSSGIDPTKPMVAISFDDGAVGTSPDSTSMRILNALSDSGFHSTFFYISDWIYNSDKEAEVKKAYDMGMEIANHTKSHPRLTDLTESEIKEEYNSCAQKLGSIIGAEPSLLLRLPYLASNETVQSALSDVPLITCSIDSQDWNGATADDICENIISAMNDGSLNGAIVLCHETEEATAEAMEYLCPYLKEHGWQVVTISEMFAANGKTLEGGKIYKKS